MSNVLKLLSDLQGEIRALEEHVEQLRDLRRAVEALEGRLAETRVIPLRGHILSRLEPGRYRVSLATGERAFLRSPQLFEKGEVFSLSGIQVGTEGGADGLTARVFREATPDDRMRQESLERQLHDQKLRLSRLEIEVYGGVGKPH